jgi:hypothetical protein
VKFLFIFCQNLKVLCGICAYSLGYIEEDIGKPLEAGFLDSLPLVCCWKTCVSLRDLWLKCDACVFNSYSCMGTLLCLIPTDKDAIFFLPPSLDL